MPICWMVEMRCNPEKNHDRTESYINWSGWGIGDAFFRTKKDCQTFINENYAYIRTRKDLREYPHGWRMPKPIKVSLRANTWLPINGEVTG